MLKAARGLGSLYAHANEMMAEAGQVHVRWTPRGWMERETFYSLSNINHPCYITGKYLVERLIAEYAEI